MQVALPADPNHCPLCGQPNECAMEMERTTGVKQPPLLVQPGEIRGRLALAHSRTCARQGLPVPGVFAGRNTMNPRPGDPTRPAAGLP